jgi:glutamate 5-kinase
MDRTTVIRHSQRAVIKIGSNVLVGEGQETFDQPVFSQLVKSVANLMNHNQKKILMVSSGAIALGRRHLGKKTAQQEYTSLPQLQALAALGQSALMQKYESEFGKYSLSVGQVLLTQSDIDDRHRFINARHTLKVLSQEMGAVPIVNENDTVAYDEIRLGDNDRLAALVSCLVATDLLIILSDIEGIYKSNPEIDPKAELLSQARTDDPGLDKLVWKKKSGPGSGGMGTKIEAARIAASAGIPTIIAPGRTPNCLDRIFQGEPIGTLLMPPGSTLDARRLWLKHGVTISGRLWLDTGAVKALLNGGKSLLPSGITQVEGDFTAGAAVDICDPDGIIIAKGLTSYSATEIIRIQGCQTAQITALLGYKTLDEVVHRDDMVITG